MTAKKKETKKVTKTKATKKKSTQKTTAKPKKAASKSRVQGTISRSLNKKGISEGTKRTIEFCFFAPLSKKVGVGGSFNNWNASKLQLTPSDTGHWRGSVTLQPGRYEYRIRVDETWECDQRECERVDNGLGSQNCVLYVS